MASFGLRRSTQEQIAILILIHLSSGINGSLRGISLGTGIAISKLKPAIKQMIADSLVTDQGVEDDEDDPDRRIGVQTRIVATQKGVDFLDQSGF